jgi:hypothetical protein
MCSGIPSATDYLRRGSNPILLQQILGHSSLAMFTWTYQHLTFSDGHEELMRVLATEPRQTQMSIGSQRTQTA